MSEFDDRLNWIDNRAQVLFAELLEAIGRLTPAVDEAERVILSLAIRLATAEREAFDERDSSGNQG